MLLAGLLALPSHAQSLTGDTSGLQPVPGSVQQALPANVLPGVQTLQRRPSGGEAPVMPPAPKSVGAPLPPPPAPSEFELYVRKLADDATIQRFGSALVTPSIAAPAAPDYNPLVPPDYLVQAGDEVAITIWGSVDADLRVVVDRSGRISLPRIGSIMLAGVRYADLPATIRARVAQVYKDFNLSVSLGQLRGLRVYVTGFVQRPGPVTVSALSTITAAVLQAGGPSAAGSLRNIELRRRGKPISKLDLYDLLLNGNEAADALLQPGDVIRVGPIGPQVALIGSVNQPAVFELRPGETVADVVRMAGGLSAVADTTRLTLERLDERATVRVVDLALPAHAGDTLQNADVLHAYSAVSAALPVARQNKRIHVEGEVAHPGDYVLPPSSTLNDALRAAGGLTGNAFVFGTEFNRESVRTTQQDNYDRALRDMETDLTRANTTQAVTSAADAAAQAAQTSAAARLLARLRAIKPTGRVVLQLSPDSRTLPDLALEDGDRLYIPAQPTTVGVFGSVFNPGSYLFSDARNIESYLKLAGGPTRGADQRSVFVIRANGSVTSGLQNNTWLGAISNDYWNQPAMPGDTIFMPEELNKTTLTQGFKDWTQILYQFGLGIAGLRVIGF